MIEIQPDEATSPTASPLARVPTYRHARMQECTHARTQVFFVSHRRCYRICVDSCVCRLRFDLSAPLNEHTCILTHELKRPHALQLDTRKVGVAPRYRTQLTDLVRGTPIVVANLVWPHRISVSFISFRQTTSIWRRRLFSTFGSTFSGPAVRDQRPFS